MNLRSLTNKEIQLLEQQGCTAEEWSNIQVRNPFDTQLLHDVHFIGNVQIGSLSKNSRELHAGRVILPTGIYRSTIANCTIGDNAVIREVRYLGNYTIGNDVTLFDLGELCASFPFSISTSEVMNECGGRAIVPFAGMRVSDAYLWAKYRNRNKLMEKLEKMSRQTFAKQKRATIGDNASILHCNSIRDLEVASSNDSPTLIENCISLSDGVVGFGNLIIDGCIAHRFCTGENVTLEQGLRLNDTVVGDNSTLARCEVAASVIFPAHQQHHNNSFLIAAQIGGQSNVAAGATIGSNHNGRTADGEIVANRGFWPGLCSNFKHSSTFASYTLIAKGNYDHELNITLPFSLVSNNAAKNQLEVIPAFWWCYNAYALLRNQKKFATRDKRIYASQHIVYEPLAPDTIEEIVCGRELLRSWTEKSYLATTPGEHVDILANAMERGKRKVVLLKASQGYQAYEEMLYYYIGSVLFNPDCPSELPQLPVHNNYTSHTRTIQWMNLGGQLVRQQDLDRLIQDIENGILSSWDDIHTRLDELWEQYPTHRYEHAYTLLCNLHGIKALNANVWQQAMQRYQTAVQHLNNRAHDNRQKDLSDTYRRMTFLCDDEQRAVLGE